MYASARCGYGQMVLINEQWLQSTSRVIASRNPSITPCAARMGTVSSISCHNGDQWGEMKVSMRLFERHLMQPR